MTKGEAIESIYINVSGGQLASDTNVRREDIGPYLGATISYVTKLDRDERISLAMRLKRHSMDLGGMFDSFSQGLMCTYKVDPALDSERDLYYAELPVRLQTLDGGLAVSDVGPLKGSLAYYPVESEQTLTGIEDVVKDQTFWFYEKDGETGSNRIYFKNLGFPVCKVRIKVLTAVEDLSDDSELPIPYGYEKLVLDLCVEYFVHQRFNHGGLLANNADVDRQIVK